MRLTTLGTGTIAFSPTRACSGALVEAGDVRLLLDCGSGVVRRLAELELDWWGITHIALTHFHIDHFGDLPTLLFGWRYGRLPGRSAPVEIIGPPGTSALLERLASAVGDWVLRPPEFAVTVREIEAGNPITLGAGAGDASLTLEAKVVPHTAESVAYSLRSARGRLVYTGDTGDDATLGEWAARCDVLLCECSLPRSMAIPVHLTPEQCGDLAAFARPRLLALTHLYPPVETVDVRAIVATRWSGAVALATDGWHTEIEDG